MKIKIALLLAMGLFVACKKEKKEDVKPTSEVARLIKDGYWNNYKSTYEIGPYQDDFHYQECLRDNYLVFSSGRYIEKEGAIACHAEEYSGTWALSSNETKMLMSGEVFEITKLTKDSMNLYMEYYDTEMGLCKLYFYYKNIK